MTSSELTPHDFSQGHEPDTSVLVVVYSKSEYPDRNEFSAEEQADVKAILPDYDGPVITGRPWSFMPQGFWEIKEMESLLQSGEAIVLRSNSDELRWARRRAREIDINEHVRKSVFPTGNELYSLAFDEFPGHVPPDTQHYNLWLRDESLGGTDLIIVVSDCLRFLNAAATETVIFEKKKRAREEVSKTVFIPGITPTVKDIRHLHIYVQRRSSQPMFARS